MVGEIKLVMNEQQTLIIEQIWSELTIAHQQKDHGWRTPAMATLTSDGQPRIRTVVLRDVDANQWQCHFYTDKRSAKCQQITSRPHGEILFWCPALKWQLRAEVTYQLLTSGPLIEKIWQRIATTSAANDYLSAQAPGSALLNNDNRRSDSTNLAVIIAKINQIDWLALSRNGHRRAKLTENSFQWLAP